MNETEKAVQEVARTTGKAIDAASKLGSFLDKIVGEGLVQIGASFSDWTQKYRYTNLLKLIDQIDAIHIKRKIEGKTTPVLPKHLIPILEYASLEDSNEIINLWAGLIANATDPNKNFQIKRLFIEILSNLDPIDAQIIEHLSNADDLMEPIRIHTKSYRNASSISEKLNVDNEDCLLSLSNLARQNLIEDGWGQTLESLDYGYAGFKVDNYKSHFALSHLGKILVKHCDVT